ncbi:hypothetical protein [Clostridium sardiniense]|uniref:hypothetical protein n=1 Tax=Clostridium sardiniense TaxID=29369 RepID=UPI003D32D3FB
MKLSKVSNYISNIAIVVAIYAGYKVFQSRMHLPQGACPVEDNSTLLYVSIAVLILSIILSFISDKFEAKNRKEIDNN